MHMHKHIFDTLLYSKREFFTLCVHREIYLPFIFLVFAADYNIVSVVLIFEACMTRVCEALSIVDDDISERMESFYLTLERTPDLDSRIILNPRDGEVTIFNDDGK